MNRMWNQVAVVLMIAVFVACCSSALAEEIAYAIVDAGDSDRLHLRAAPSSKSDSLGLYFTGTQVEVTGVQIGAYVPVRVGVLEGFMHADYLKDGEASRFAASRQPIGVATPKTGARLRCGPSKEYETLDVIDQGAVFIVLGETRDHWYDVEVCGLRGYVSAEAANLVDEVDGCPTVFASILRGEDSFMMHGGAKRMDELDVCFDMEAALSPAAFAVLDVDADGLDEMVLRVAAAGEDIGCLVLDLQTEVVYGFAFHFRSMNGLKQDGTFGFSSGAMDGGVGRVAFRGPVADVTEIARCHDAGSGEVVCTIRGEIVDWLQYEAFLRVQEEKADAMWRPFNEEAIADLFAR